MEGLLIQELLELVVMVETEAAAVVEPTMAVTMGVEEILVETPDSTAQDLQETLLVETVVEEVLQVVEMAAQAET
jgi:hypothetical protein